MTMDISIEILVYILLSYILGFITAWGIQSIQHKRELAHLERTWQINMASQTSKSQK